MSEHRCKPSKIGGRAHDAAPNMVVVCSCGKAWGPTKTHHGKRGSICGCGWVHLPGVTASYAQHTEVS